MIPLTKGVIKIILFTKDGFILQVINGAADEQPDSQTVEQLSKLVCQLMLSQQTKFVTTNLNWCHATAVSKSCLGLLVLTASPPNTTVLKVVCTLLLATLLALDQEFFVGQLDEIDNILRQREESLTAADTKTDRTAETTLLAKTQKRLRYFTSLVTQTILSEYPFTMEAGSALLVAPSTFSPGSSMYVGADMEFTQWLDAPEYRLLEQETLKGRALLPVSVGGLSFAPIPELGCGIAATGDLMRAARMSAQLGSLFTQTVQVVNAKRQK